MYRRFGSEVTIVEMSPRLIAREDEDVVRRRSARSSSDEGDRRPHEREVHRRSRRDPRACASASTARRARPRSTARTCCSPSAAGPTRTTSASTRPASTIDARGYIVVDDQLRTNVAGHLGARRLQRPRRLHAHGLQRLRDRRREPARRRSAARERPHRDLRALHRPAARPRRHDRGRPREGRPARILVGKRPMTKVKRAVEKGETQGFMKVVVDAEIEADPRRGDPRHRRRRGRSTRSST